MNQGNDQPCRRARAGMLYGASVILALFLFGIQPGRCAAVDGGVQPREVVVVYSDGAPRVNAPAAKPGSSGTIAARGTYDFSGAAGLEQIARRHRLLGVDRVYVERQKKGRGLKGGQPEIHRLAFPADANVDQCIAEIRKLPGVLLAERNQTGELCYTPGDPLYSQTAADLALVQTQAAWDIQPGADATVTVAVVDSGVEPTHPDLQGVLDLANSYNFVAGNTDIFDDLGHGTRVAGIIGAAGNDGQGIAGIAFGCRVMSLDVTTSNGVVTTANVASAILWAKDHGARIINLSLRFQAPSEILKLACDTARDAGCLLVAAAGNENQSQNAVYPASYDSVLAVGALMDDGVTRAPWSNYNVASGIKLADVVAPGCTIFSCIPGGQYNGSYGSGTSFAAPMVSGVAALLAARYPLQSGLAIGQQIKATADSLGVWAGSGRLNAQKALQEAMAPSFSIQSVRVDDAVAYGGANDADGFMEPGENVRICISLKNNGADADNVQATLSESNPDVTLTDTTGVWGSIRAIASVENSLNGFDGVSLAAGSAAQDAAFHLAIVAGGGSFTQGLDFTVPTERNLIPPAFIDADTTWTRNNTYSLVRNTVVNPGVKLVIEAGTKIRCNANGGLEVQGALDVRGEANSKVVLTGIDGTRPAYAFDPPVEFVHMTFDTSRGAGIVGLDDINNDGTLDYAVWKGVGYSSQANYAYTYWTHRGYNFGYLTSSENRYDGYPTAFGDINADGLKEGPGGTFSYAMQVRTFIYPFTLYRSGSFAISGYTATNVEDVDGDGDNDIVAAGNSTLVALMNPGNGAFSGSFVSTNAPKSIKPAISDTDGDGIREIWTNRTSAPAFYQAKWNGSSFTGTYYALPAAVGPEFVVDLDEDGRKEVAAYAPSTGCIYKIEWNGSGYDAPTSVALAVRPASDADVQLADLDQDGLTDILAYDQAPMKFWMQRGLPGGTFDAPILMQTVATAPVEWRVGDLSNDGLPDLVLHYTNPANGSERVSALCAMDTDFKNLHKGLWIRSTASASTIRNLVVQYGPVKDEASNTTWQDCLFERNYPYDVNNQANYAFISAAGSIPITRCTVKGNRDGGGMNAGAKQLIDCVAQDNWGVGLLGGNMQQCQGIHNYSYGLQSSSTITSGTATRNADWGIKATGAVTGSTAHDNVNGIDAGSATHCVALDNQQVGIKSG
ncbi:S8 family serine peptidase, partial [bacterium]|nr:S8 family serine peptidase [bacterium]